ncbi:unnamed protein product [Arabis nemorensis]|uniref:Phytocyanin domain-containing protein n=1 Tax=Arabis nemorensis TaxID=586526 RepID=A0A565BGW2_9BRAS|nr:unnamed protein product [Arabis nemorensis]
MGSSKIVLLSILHIAGGANGWIIPNSSNHEDVFDQWASKNRFKIGDTIRFKYKKDSVLVVSEEEYKKCQTTKPEFYSNKGGDTVFKLNRHGLFYFISGVSGHCEKGQKMIIKVMEVESPPPSSSLSASTHKSNNAVKKTTRFVGAGLVAFSTLVLTVFSLV